MANEAPKAYSQEGKSQFSRQSISFLQVYFPLVSTQTNNRLLLRLAYTTYTTYTHLRRFSLASRQTGCFQNQSTPK